ncbi:MAG: hypothetical protein HYT80_01390 [Euryarchaeota archaeon]|nr:hypothetical protein [Euryarchaeota archaeon]
MAKGLDVGTMNLVSTQLEKGKYVIKQQRNMFLEMDANEVTGQMLQQANILHMKMGNEYVIVGEDALNFSTVMNTDAKPRAPATPSTGRRTSSTTRRSSSTSFERWAMTPTSSTRASPSSTRNSRTRSSPGWASRAARAW